MVQGVAHHETSEQTRALPTRTSVCVCVCVCVYQYEAVWTRALLLKHRHYGDNIKIFKYTRTRTVMESNSCSFSAKSSKAVQGRECKYVHAEMLDNFANGLTFFSLNVGAIHCPHNALNGRHCPLKIAVDYLLLADCTRKKRLTCCHRICHDISLLCSKSSTQI